MTRWHIIIGLLVALQGGVAQAETESVTIGIYLPDLPGIERGQRLRATQSLAAYLNDTTGLAVEGRAFSSGADLVNLGRRKSVDYVIAPAQFIAALGWKPIARLVRGGASSAPWTILSKSTIRTVDERRLA